MYLCKGHFAKLTFCRMGILPVDPFVRMVFCRMDTSRNGHVYLNNQKIQFSVEKD